MDFTFERVHGEATPAAERIHELTARDEHA